MVKNDLILTKWQKPDFSGFWGSFWDVFSTFAKLKSIFENDLF
jgi:hypothetical protein